MHKKMNIKRVLLVSLSATLVVLGVFLFGTGAIQAAVNNIGGAIYLNGTNVGIGTSTSTYPLGVVGQINTSGGLCIAGDCKTAWSQVGGGSWVTTSTGVYYSGGNVGIGTTSPVQKLQVVGGTRWGGASAPYVYSNTDVGGLYIEQVGSGASDSKIRLQSSLNGAQSAYLQFFIDPTNGYAFAQSGSANGNVGIGTTTPGSKLDVSGTGNFTGTVTVATPTATSHAVTKSYVDGVASKWTLSGSNIYPNSTSYNVGIGTTSPASSLHVKNAVAGWQTQFHNDYGGTAASYAYFSHGGGYGSHIRSYNASDGIYVLELYNSTTAVADFWASGRTALGLAGNVGIGTQSPSYKLDVAGSIRAQNYVYTDSNYGYGHVGLYSASRNQMVYAMGDAYKMSADGSSLSNMYGISWTYDGNGYTSYTGYNCGHGFGNVTAGSYRNYFGHGCSWINTPLYVGGQIYANGNIQTPNLYMSNSAYGIRGNFGYFDTINTGSSGDPLEINYAVAGNLRMYNGHWTQQYGYYLFPGSNGGLGDFQTSYYLASNVSWGLYTNTSMYSAGGFYAPGFYYYSDVRMKKDIVPVAGLDIIKNINGVTFTWKDSGKRDAGVIAQDVEKVFPEAVITTKEAGMKTVSAGALMAPIVQSIKELKDESDAKSLRIDSLEKEIQELRNIIGK